MHTPVFLEAVIEALGIEPGKKYIDCTVGEGGHLYTIAERGGVVLGIDYDQTQIKKAAERKQQQVTLVHGNFKELGRIANDHGFTEVDGILMDLGLSMRQYAEKHIGLSFKHPDEPLDMRLEGTGMTAADVLNQYSHQELRDMFIENAEEVSTDQIVREIGRFRERKPIQTVGDLNTILEHALGEMHTAVRARIYQALRIEVNQEFSNLRQALTSSRDLLRDDGRLVVITFHSLEDRIVKEFGKKQPSLRQLKIKIPRNSIKPFERSAHLRVFQKITL